MKKGKTIWGLGLVIAGLLLFGDLLGLLPSGINWMTMTMSALVAAGAIVNLLSRKYANAIMLITLGVIINRESLGIDGNIWLILFIGALLSIGVSLLLKDHSVIIRMEDGEHFTMGKSSSMLRQMVRFKSHLYSDRTLVPLEQITYDTSKSNQ